MPDLGTGIRGFVRAVPAIEEVAQLVRSHLGLLAKPRTYSKALRLRGAAPSRELNVELPRRPLTATSACEAIRLDGPIEEAPQEFVVGAWCHAIAQREAHAEDALPELGEATLLPKPLPHCPALLTYSSRRTLDVFAEHPLQLRSASSLPAPAVICKRLLCGIPATLDPTAKGPFQPILEELARR